MIEPTTPIECDSCGSPIHLGWIISSILNGKRQLEVVHLCHQCYEIRAREGIKRVDAIKAERN